MYTVQRYDDRNDSQHGQRWLGVRCRITAVVGQAIALRFICICMYDVLAIAMSVKNALTCSLLLLQVRVKVLNDELHESFRKWYPQFEIKKAADKEATDTENSEELALSV